MAISTPAFRTGTGITVDDHAVLTMLQALAKRTSDTRPAMASVGNVLVNRIKMGFRLGRDPWGTPWLPLKMRKGQPLVDKGRLRASISYRATPTEVIVGTNLKYAKVHQFGATIHAKQAPYMVFKNAITGAWLRKKQVTVPARPFMPLLPGGQANVPLSWSQAAVAAVRNHILAHESAKQAVLSGHTGA